jgi:quercetin dioxygenase-like cupin family protein
MKSILTSRDPLAVAMRADLAVDDLAHGFDRTLLPLAPTSGSPSIFTGAANSKTGKHSHESNTLHVILTGSVKVNAQELSSGDWAYIPAGMDYELEVGMYCCVVMYWHW